MNNDDELLRRLLDDDMLSIGTVNDAAQRIRQLRVSLEAATKELFIAMERIKELSLEVDQLNEMVYEIGKKERDRIVAWLRVSAADIVGQSLTGEFYEDMCDSAAEAVELAADMINEGIHWGE
jgi:hypothetical protein